MSGALRLEEVLPSIRERTILSTGSLSCYVCLGQLWELQDPQPWQRHPAR